MQNADGAAAIVSPSIVHSLPGRVRISIADLTQQNQRRYETALRQTGGVQSVRANPLTGKVLIEFDSARTTSAQLLETVQNFTADVPVSPPEEERVDASLARKLAVETKLPAPAVHAFDEVIAPERPLLRRARIALRGLDRNPQLARRVVHQLERIPGVLKAKANPLTGRVLVEWTTEHQLDLEDLVSEVAGLELPELICEDSPDHPLDPAPLLQSAVRSTGAAIGLAVLGVQRMSGAQAPFLSGAAPAYIGGIIGIVQSFQPFRQALRTLLGPNLGQLFLTVPDILLSTLGGSPLALALNGIGAFQVVTEVVSRRAAWRRYEERLSTAADAQAGATIRLDSGERTPLAATVDEGTGTAIGTDGLPVPVGPGAKVAAGARLGGGPFVLTLGEGKAYNAADRPAPCATTFYDRYQQIIGIASPVIAAITGIVTRSPARAFESLLLVNPRPSIIGQEAANTRAAAHVLRAGATIVGSRPDRKIRKQDVLLIESARVLTHGLEVTSAVTLSDQVEADVIVTIASAVSEAAGAPWGATAFPRVRASDRIGDGHFEDGAAHAVVNDVSYSVSFPRGVDAAEVAATTRLERRGEMILVLRRGGDGALMGLLTLRPRLAPAISTLVAICRRGGVETLLIAGGDQTVAAMVAKRAGIQMVAADADESLRLIHDRQAKGARVAYLSDSADAAEQFAACDLAIGLSSGRSGRFPARADVLAPDLRAVAAIVDAGLRREAAVRDSVVLSAISNIVGIVLGVRGGTSVERASRGVYIAALAAIGSAYLRQRGGDSGGASLRARLADPRPERWGKRGVESVLGALQTTEQGITMEAARKRRSAAPTSTGRHPMLLAVLEQLRSPLVGILAVGAGLTAVMGSPLDFSLIALTVLVNVAVGVYQERQAGRATEALARMTRATARVLRDGEVTTIAKSEIVVGDVIVLASGDRVPADARLIVADQLEVDEAALTGESLPVRKRVDMPMSDGSGCVVLEGSDVTTGTARAAVVAIGAQTRLGATATALTMDETEQSPLGVRLALLLRQFLPIAVAGGAIVVASGWLRGAALIPQLGVGATIALAAVPEGLPLLAGMGEAAVARRLAKHHAVVQRLSAVEALGRVDVACTDKTGTLTEGRLGLTTLLSDDGSEAAEAEDGPIGGAALSPRLEQLLLTGSLACPAPDSEGANAHATDVSVVQAAKRAGLLARVVEAIRGAEAPFDAAARPFHATAADDRICVKGAPEAVAARCLLDDEARIALLQHAETLAHKGLRVLLVAEGAGDLDVADPQNLKPLGFLGIRDPLRAGVRHSVERCRTAGIRVMMLTGDHPATAEAIARSAGLLNDAESADHVLTSAHLAELYNGDLDRALAGAVVIARATPLDKLRIIESLQRQGHVVAMTGDGVNDAPALRLADVGVAMGKGGTEVARSAADVVLTDDDFSTLVEALVEGRGFWQNTRRAIGLLLGGNLGELALVVAASVVGVAPPLVVRQILAVNLITDALPALAVALQRPEHRRLDALAREGTAAVDTSLRRDVVRRTFATALPTLAAFLIAYQLEGLAAARTVAFAGIVSTQLAQTLRLGWTESGISGLVTAAVGTSYALLLAALTIPAIRSSLLLTFPTPLGWGLIATATVTSVLFASLPVLDAEKRYRPKLAAIAAAAERLTAPLPAPPVPPGRLQAVTG